MAEFPYDPGTPTRTDFSVADIKVRTNFELLKEFPQWDTDTDAWLEFRSEARRLGQCVGDLAIRSYLFTAGSSAAERRTNLGIFIRHDAIPEGGIASLL